MLFNYIKHKAFIILIINFSVKQISVIVLKQLISLNDILLDYIWIFYCMTFSKTNSVKLR